MGNGLCRTVQTSSAEIVIRSSLDAFEKPTSQQAVRKKPSLNNIHPTINLNVEDCHDILISNTNEECPSFLNPLAKKSNDDNKVLMESQPIIPTLDGTVNLQKPSIINIEPQKIKSILKIPETKIIYQCKNVRFEENVMYST